MNKEVRRPNCCFSLCYSVYFSTFVFRSDKQQRAANGQIKL